MRGFPYIFPISLIPHYIQQNISSIIYLIYVLASTHDNQYLISDMYLSVLIYAMLFSMIPFIQNAPSSDAQTFLGKIFCGYQGWFTASKDGTQNGWTHYKLKSGQPFSKQNCLFDLWPDSSEYQTKYQPPEMGSQFSLFSPNDYSTIRTHFEWMKQYRIDGVFLQRFGSDIRNPGSNIYRFKNNVFENVMNAAQQTDRLWCLMYDLSGLTLGQIKSVIMEDWKYLNTKFEFRLSQNYIQHQGKPLIAIWGLGFNDHRNYTLDQCQELISFLKSGQFGGNSIMIGVPRYWKNGGGDAVQGQQLQKLHEIVLQSDIISPWTVGRYSNIQGIQSYAKTVQQEVQWCEDNRLEFFPVIFPGFSWHNLQATIENPKNPAPYNQIPRKQNGSYFLEQQGKAFISKNAKSLYVAMFDEINEGTAIFKCVQNPPKFSDGLSFVGYGDQPSDFYLDLTGKIGKLLKGQKETQIQNI